MITQFLEGETYTNPKMEQDIMVLGLTPKADDSVLLSILFVDRESTESTKFGELTVHASEFSDWTVKEYE